MQAHDVPTHLQAEDRVLLGLTFPQIVAGMAVLGLAYGVWQRAVFLPEGHWRTAAAVTFAILGLAGIVVRPGGRALPAVVLDLLRFALTPKRYGGEIAGLLQPPVVESRPKAKRNKKRWLRAGLPFRLLSFTLAVSVVLASVAPSAAVMAAAPPEDAQRLFIESWTVRGNRAELSVRAATSLTVQVIAQTGETGESFRARDVLYRGERRTYSVPLRDSHRAIAISWNDALGNAGHAAPRPQQLPISDSSSGDIRLHGRRRGDRLEGGRGRWPHLRRLRGRSGGGGRGRRPHRPRRPHEVGGATSAAGRHGRGGDGVGPPGRIGSRDQRLAADGLRARRRDGLQHRRSGHTFATTPAGSPCTPSGHGPRCYSSSATRSPGRACCG